MLIAHWYALKSQEAPKSYLDSDLPQDSRRALARGESLPDHAEGVALCGALAVAPDAHFADQCRFRTMCAGRCPWLGD
jgi:hypothetical protein